MDRRGFLRTGLAAGGATGLHTTELGALGRSAAADSSLPDPAVVDGLLRSIDRRLAWIDEQRELPPGLPTPSWLAAGADPARAEKAGRLFRKSMRTLYLTGRSMDLPDEILMHPGYQARLAAAQDDMDEAVLGTAAMLEALTAEDHRAMQRKLRAHPQIGEELASLLDKTAAEDGLPFARRAELSASTLDLARRMGAQSPALTIDPYVKRVRKIEAQTDDAGENARRMAARIGERAFWEHERRLASLAARWDERLAQAPTSSGQSGAAPVPAATGAAKKPKKGGKLMGIGGLSIAAGLVFYGIHAAGVGWAAGPAVVLGITVGPILLLIGLIMYLSS